ncbi:MAG: hypothetical protein R3E79_13405 [Caldilineaceae bacterium]
MLNQLNRILLGDALPLLIGLGIIGVSLLGSTRHRQRLIGALVAGVLALGGRYLWIATPLL